MGTTPISLNGKLTCLCQDFVLQHLQTRGRGAASPQQTEGSYLCEVTLFDEVNSSDQPGCGLLCFQRYSPAIFKQKKHTSSVHLKDLFGIIKTYGIFRGWNKLTHTHHCQLRIRHIYWCNQCSTSICFPIKPQHFILAAKRFIKTLWPHDNSLN